MSETTNLKLQKPGDDGVLDIKVIDSNMDIIDGAVAGKAESDHSHSAGDIGALPTGTGLSVEYDTAKKIEDKIESLSAEDIGAIYVVAESLGANGYRKYSDGRIEQWGTGTATGNTNTTITLPDSFSNTDYRVLITHNSTSTSDSYALKATSYSESQFKVANSTGTSWDFSYIALGN